MAAIERELALKIVSPALKHLVFPVLSRSGYLRRTAGAGPAVVTYHGVLPPGYQVQNPSLDGNLVSAEALSEFEGHVSGFYRALRERILGSPEVNH